MTRAGRPAVSARNNPIISSTIAIASSISIRRPSRTALRNSISRARASRTRLSAALFCARRSLSLRKRI
ncbi:hypothetical protein CWO91_05600 [Bradyrhizobium genosp. SA-3]|nr:hypothetical protein CWO91_05600 [Bradyrhizobium genosp. SA-3]